MIIDNPCYHCYMGAIGECIRCNHYGKSYSGDLESKEIDVDLVSDGHIIKGKEPESMFKGGGETE